MEFIELAPLQRETVLTEFIPIPKPLLDLDLPFSAVLLYGELLKRGLYSQLTDGNGRVYVICTVANLARIMGVKPRCVQTGLNQLEEYGLVRREHPVRNRASHIYLNIPAVSQKTDSNCTKMHPRVQEKTASPCTKRHTNINTNINNKYIYQYHQEDSL